MVCHECWSRVSFDIDFPRLWVSRGSFELVASILGSCIDLIIKPTVLGYCFGHIHVNIVCVSGSVKFNY